MTRIHVAAGVILNDDNEVLLALRPSHKHQGGLWEFPGGKVEAGEKVDDALARELMEELNLAIEAPQPFLVTEHDYADKHVKLDVWLVRRFSGEPHGREGQQLRWVPLRELPGYRFPQANVIIVERLLQELA
ncbi:MAG TPA: 8-oxo-dGTP diphosphatase MutT [Candidatus Acidoferrum sp.]|nr:8-oxo-dGTP diphosphatase MutT [Candidatus Acidoferrum sp.]